MNTRFGIVAICQLFGHSISLLLLTLFLDRNEKTETINQGLLITFNVSSFIATLISILLMVLAKLCAYYTRSISKDYEGCEQSLIKDQDPDIKDKKDQE